ncbi:hypothetical protein BaRGS_00008321, partial [Batillaria attramentaria]
MSSRISQSSPDSHDKNDKTEARLSFELLFYFSSLVGFPVSAGDITRKDTKHLEQREASEAWKAETEQLPVSYGPRKNLSSLLQRIRSVELSCSKRLVRFLLFTVLQLANIVRCAFALQQIKDKGQFTGNIVATLSYLLGFLRVFLVFCATCPTLKVNLPRLVAKIRSYERRYGFSFSVRDLNTSLKKVVISVSVLFITATLSTMTSLVLMYPFYKKQMMPFHEAEDAELAIVVVAYWVFFATYCFVEHAPFHTMAVVAYIARKEFLYLGRMAEKEFTPKDSEDECFDDLTHNIQADVEEKCFATGQNTSGDSISKESDPKMSPVPRAHTDSVGPFCHEKQQELQRSAYGRSLGVLGSEKDISKRHTAQQGGLKFGYVKNEVCEEKARDISELHVDTQNCAANALENISVINLQTSFENQRDLHRSGVLDPDVTLEMTFDKLRRRHEAICEIIECCQRCFCHAIPALYTFGITSICIIIYALASRSLRKGELVYTSGSLWGLLQDMTFCTILGCVVNDTTRKHLATKRRDTETPQRAWEEDTKDACPGSYIVVSRNNGKVQWKDLFVRIKAFLKERFVFFICGFLQVMFLVRAVLTLKLVLNKDHIDGNAVASVSYFLGWLKVLIIYIATYSSLSSSLPNLMTQIRSYETRYGFSFDVSTFHTKVKRLLVLVYGIYILFGVSFITTGYTLFPGFRLQMAPFQDTEGAVFAVVVIAYTFLFLVVCIAAWSTQHSLAVLTYVARTEFLLARLTQKEFSKTKNDTWNVSGKGRYSTLESGVVMTEVKPPSDCRIYNCESSTRHFGQEGQVATSNETQNFLDTKKRGFVQSVAVAGEAATHQLKLKAHGKERAISYGMQNIPEATLPGSTQKAVGVDETELYQLKSRTSSVAQRTRENPRRKRVYGLSMSSTFQKASRKKLSKITRPKFMTDTGTSGKFGADSFPTSLSAGDEKGQVLEDEADHDLGVALETTFDYLRRRHDDVCEIMESCQRCFCHTIPMSYALGICTVCFAIYAFASESLSRGDLVFSVCANSPEMEGTHHKQNKTEQCSRLSFDVMVHFMWVVGYPVRGTRNLKNGPQTSDLPTRLDTFPKSDIGSRKDAVPNLEITTPRPPAAKSAWTADGERSPGFVGKLTGHLKQNVVFGTLALIQLTNIVRILPGMVLEFGHGPLGSYTVAAVSYLLSWIQALVLFLATYMPVKKHLPDLRAALRYYEDTYGFSFDVCSFNRRAKVMNVVWWVLFAVVTAALLTPLVIVFPEFKKQFYPYQNSEGATFVIVACAYYTAFFVVSVVYSSSVQTTHYVCFIAKNEFLHIARKVEELLPAKNYKNLENKSKCTDLISGDCTDEPSDTNTYRQAQDEQHEGVPQKLRTKTNRRQRKSPQLLRTRNFCDGRVTDSDQSAHAKPESISRDKTYDILETKPTIGSRADQDNDLEKDPDLGGDSLEKAFDVLHDRHEAMCAITEVCQRCFYHTLPSIYAFGITTCCFVIYSLASGSLKRGDLAMTSFVLWVHAQNMVFSGIWACILNDS